MGQQQQQQQQTPRVPAPVQPITGPPAVVESGSWEYEGRARWHPFDASISTLLEHALSAGLAKVRYTSDGKEYEADFKDRKQRRVDDSTRVRKIRRLGTVSAVSQAFDLMCPVATPALATRLSPAPLDLIDVFFRLAVQDAFRGVPYVNLDEIFDLQANRDYRNLVDNVSVMLRGGLSCDIPVGWKGYTVKTSLHKYDGGDKTWMGMNGGPGEWAVALHGLKEGPKKLLHILSEGFKPGPAQVFAGQCGIGIYCTPNLATAERYCGKCFFSDGQQVKAMQFMLQCRVRPEAIKRPNPETIRLATDANGIWLVNDTRDIRPYRVLVKFC